MPVLGVLGAGAMGSGIAQVAAQNGWEVQLVDVNDEALQKSETALRKILNRQVEKGRMTDQEVVALLGRIYYGQSLERFNNADLVIEAIVENMKVKQSVFQEIEQIVPPKCILASNTSSLSVTEIAAACQRPERLLGIHFFNPAPLMKLVEVVPAVQTDTGIVAQAEQIISNWGKYTVLAKDTPGFIVNKVARPFYSESIRILEEGIADVATIDHALTHVGGFRMGPFTLMDYIGHDVNYKVTESVWKAFYYDGRYKPSFTQKALVAANYLGRKTGKGFYDYAEGAEKPEPKEDARLNEQILHRVLCMLVNEAADTVFSGICTEEDVEKAMLYGVNYPKGLLAWGQEIGYGKVVQTLDEMFARYKDERYRACPYLRDRI